MKKIPTLPRPHLRLPGSPAARIRSILNNASLQSNLLFLGGIASLFIGLWWIYPPAALIILGLVLFVAALALDPPKPPTDY